MPKKKAEPTDEARPKKKARPKREARPKKKAQPTKKPRAGAKSGTRSAPRGEGKGGRADSSRTSLVTAARRMGIETLHPEQTEAITALLEGADVLVVQPTGFGKSACYQIPSLLLPRPVVVVSPLLALLADQHRKMVERDLPCVRIDGSVRGRARREAFERLAEGGPLLVMTTPETFVAPELHAALASVGVGLVAVDEAHCISEWGHDFRPAYRRIGVRIEELGDVPKLALTATATEEVREAIVGALRMRAPRLVTTSPHRSNLAFEVSPCEGDARLRLLVRLVQRLRRPGIVYCATRREVDDVYVLLRRFEVPSHRYHGGMTKAEREREQQGFMRQGRRSTIVATSAFGLGIDKPDIRYVLHAQSPASLEQYVQEAGRAGRDGRRASCILLHDPADRRIHEALLARSRLRPEQLYRVGEALATWASEGDRPTLEALALSAELGIGTTKALVATLEEAGLVSRDDAQVALVTPDDIHERVRELARQFERLRIEDGHRLDALDAYAQSERCRAVVLRTYFGEDPGEDCGLCDRCHERPPRAASWFEPLSPPKQGARTKKTARGRRRKSPKKGARRRSRSGSKRGRGR